MFPNRPQILYGAYHVNLSRVNLHSTVAISKIWGIPHKGRSRFKLLSMFMENEFNRILKLNRVDCHSYREITSCIRTRDRQFVVSLFVFKC